MVTNNNNKVVFYGSDIKLRITVDFGEDVDMDSTSFNVKLFCGDKSLILEKKDLVKLDKNNYIACVKSPDTSKGSLKAEICAIIADNDFSDGKHTVVSRYDTGIMIL